jgi:hypothetical protein
MNRDATSANHLLQGLAKKDPQLLNLARLGVADYPIPQPSLNYIMTSFEYHSPKRIWQTPSLKLMILARKHPSETIG